MKMVCVILAGGQGRRIGGAKPRRLLAGATLLNRAISKARVWSEVVGVAVRERGQHVPGGTRVVEDAPEVEGPLGGLLASLRFGSEEGAEAVLILPADMPFLPSDLRLRLQAALLDSAAAIASSGGRLHPICGLWRTECVAEIPAYFSSGKRSLKGFAAMVGAVVVDWSVHPVDPFFNINTPEDLAAAERVLRA